MKRFSVIFCLVLVLGCADGPLPVDSGQEPNCTKSYLCGEHGWCTYFPGTGCRPGSDADCAKSDGCALEGTCKWDGKSPGSCVKH